MTRGRPPARSTAAPRHGSGQARDVFRPGHHLGEMTVRGRVAAT